MNFLKTISPFLFFFMLFQSCSNPTEPVKPIEHPIMQKSEIPNFVIASADSFIISKVGPTFFLSYIKYDSSRSEFSPSDTFCIAHPSNCLNYLRYASYRMVYTFRIPEKPWIDEIIEFAVDSVGNIILERSPYGIPECLSIPSCCVFGIDSATAIGIARQAGLEDGINPWRTNFYWYGGDINKYVWSISNDLSEGGGKEVVIDSNSGVVIYISLWVAIQ